MEFDQKGARISPPPLDAANTTVTTTPSQWDSCLIIKMFEVRPSWDMARMWDRHLEQFVLMDRWQAESYNAQTNNCFDFVLEFLRYDLALIIYIVKLSSTYPSFSRSLNLDHFKSSTVSKTKFCEHFIVPRTKLLARYISLYRKVQTEKIVTLEN